MSYLLEIESYHMTVVLNGMSVIGPISPCSGLILTEET